MQVHLGSPLNPIFLPASKQNHAVSLTLHNVLREPLHIDPLQFILSDLKWEASECVLQ